PRRHHRPGKVKSVVPAKAGTHQSAAGAAEKWIPAFAGMTNKPSPTYSAAMAPAWNGAGAARSVSDIGAGHHLSSHSENSGRNFGKTCSANSLVLYFANSLP